MRYKQLFLFFVMLFLASSMVSASYIITNLSATDTGDWVGFNNMLTVSSDASHDLMYLAGQNGRFGVYNRTSNITQDLSSTDTNNWIGTSQVNSITYDSVHDLVYIGANSGKFGVYNRTSNVATNLSGTFFGGWMGNTNIVSLDYDSVHDLVYIGANSGKFGVYNRTSNVASNLSLTDTSDWLGTSNIADISYAPIPDLLYIGAALGKFGVYNRTSNVATNLSGTDTGDWIGTDTVSSLSYSSQGDSVFIGATQGKLGIYNRTSNVAQDLSSTDVGGWMTSLSSVVLSYESARSLVFISTIDLGTPSGAFGAYSIANNVSYNLSSRNQMVKNPPFITAMSPDNGRIILYVTNLLGSFGMLVNFSSTEYLSAFVNFTIVAQKDNASTNVTGICYNNESMNVTYNLSLNGATLLNQFLAPNLTVSSLAQMKNGVNTAQMTCTNILGESAFMSMSQNVFYRKYSIFDEATLLPITSNVTITFTSNITQYVFNTVTSRVNVTIPSDDYNVMFQTTGYSTRLMTLIQDVYDPENISVYLQNTSASNAITFTIVDEDLSTMPLTGVLMQMYRMIGGTLTLVESQYSDVTGSTLFHCAPDVEYTFVLTYAGYITKTFALIPHYTPITVTMKKDVGVGGLPDYGGVQAGYTPTTFFSNTNNNITIRFYSADGLLLSYGYTITYPSGSVSDSGILSKGEIFNTNFTIPDVDEFATVNITYFYNATHAGYRTFTFTHGVSVVRKGTLMYNKDRTFGLGILDRVIIGSIVVIFIVGLAGLAAGLPIGLALGLLVASIFIYIGFLPYWSFILTIVIGFLILLWRSDI